MAFDDEGHDHISDDAEYEDVGDSEESPNFSGSEDISEVGYLEER